MLPRCGDEDLDVRCTAVDAIQRILYIDQLLDEPSNTTPKHEVKIISDIKSKVADFGDIGEVLGDLAGLLGLTVKVGSGIDLIKQAIQNCCDSDRSSARASARVMRGLVRHHVAEIPASVPDLVEEFLTALPDVASEVQDAVSEGFKVLVGSHFEAVITRLLQESAPLSEAALQLFGCLMDSDHKTNIPEQTLRKLFTVMNETTLNEDTPTPIAQTATAAFAHLMGMEHQKSLLQELYAECMVSLLLRCGTARGADPLSEEDSVVGLQKFLRSVGHESVSDGMDKEMAWEQLSTDAFDEGVTSYARLWACEEGNSPRVLMKFLSHFYSQQSLKGQRIVAVSMIAEFVQRVEDDETLVKDLIKFLLPRTTDKVEKVRKQAIRGLGNLVKCWHLTDMSMIAGSILSGLTTASEDKNAEVASEAVRALTRLCDVIGESTMGPMLNTMCFRLRPAFDRDDASVRAAAFSLFGALTRFGRAAEFKKEFEDELHQTLMMCVCHTNDKEESVRAAAFAALKECAETLESKEMLSAMAEVDATPEQYHYDPLAKQLVAVMLSQYGDNRLRGYVDTCMTYLSSKWKDIRSASVYALAQLMAHASDSQKLKVNASTVVEAMIKLLSGKNAQVRDKTARALSLLHKY
jgi:HEAT repeat protein